jgi:hypothetical protein
MRPGGRGDRVRLKILAHVAEVMIVVCRRSTCGWSDRAGWQFAPQCVFLEVALHEQKSLSGVGRFRVLSFALFRFLPD